MTTTTALRIHAPIHGMLPEDKGIEFYADLTSHRMFFMQAGERKSFHQLPRDIAAALIDKLTADKKARQDLAHLPINEAMERFAFCVYGGADHMPDVNEKGELQESDNFRCSNNCSCLKWESKKIGDTGFNLTNKEIQVLDQLATGDIDVVCASNLNITTSTLSTHRKNLFVKLNVQSTTALVMKAAQLKIIQ